MPKRSGPSRSEDDIGSRSGPAESGWELTGHLYLAAATSGSDLLRSPTGQRPEYSTRKEEILDTLEDIFLTEGFRYVTIEDLVRRAHCSRGTLYDLAPTKEALFIVVLDRLWCRLGLRAQEAIRQASDPAAQLEAYLFEASALFRPSPRFLEDIEAYAAARRLFDDHVAIAIDFLARLVAAGIELGNFRPVPPRLAAEVLSAAASQFAGRTTGAADAIHQAVRMILYGLVDDAADSSAAVRQIIVVDGRRRTRRSS